MANELTKTDMLNEWITKNSPFKSFPLYELILNVCDICNRTCRFCPRGNGYFSPHNSPYMELSLLNKICDDVTPNFTGLFSLSGFGEPTIHPKIKEIIDIIKNKCPKANILIITNGDYYEKLLDIEGINVEFSMYEPFSDEKLEKLSHMKSPYKIKDIENTSKKFFNNRAGNANFGVKLDKPLQQCCNLPFYKMDIDINGDVLLCCSDWYRKDIIGNVYKENVLDVWNNSKYFSIRSNLINGNRKDCKLCSKCNTNGLLLGDEFVKYWKDNIWALKKE